MILGIYSTNLLSQIFVLTYSSWVCLTLFFCLLFFPFLPILVFSFILEAQSSSSFTLAFSSYLALTLNLICHYELLDQS